MIKSPELTATVITATVTLTTASTSGVMSQVLVNFTFNVEPPPSCACFTVDSGSCVLKAAHVKLDASFLSALSFWNSLRIKDGLNQPVGENQEWVFDHCTCDETASHLREAGTSEQESNNKRKDIVSMKVDRA
ncbi:hypothetical protein PROFUN_04658 [Planoprotostelium fungivorum]|uniref:Uncharacterized protein n=1 Tax=Planoprotostelium fungivorum TaxID=1890364 RepID=A0A2P6NUI9_9EUKA|nr:hypothetical protein PROFUN_04658 [Planoprotostelium fungivorum]